MIFLHLTVFKIYPGQDFKVRITRYLSVILVWAMYVYNARVTTEESKVKLMSNQDVAQHIFQPISLLSINFLHLTVSEIFPRQYFKDRDHCCKIKGQINVAHINPRPMFPPSMNIQYLLFPRYREHFSCFPSVRLPIQSEAIGENNSHTAKTALGKNHQTIDKAILENQCAIWT